MKILQLCCFTNLWGPSHQVYSIDLRLKRNIFDYPQDYGKNFDLVCAAPPCDQYTKANSNGWVANPVYFNNVAEHCFNICRSTGNLWFLENPPGRIETFFPALKKFRIVTWHGGISKKEYVIYGNFIFLLPGLKRYSGTGSNSNMTKKQREKWQPDLIFDISRSINLLL